jgi:asparagine synthase (glutamine-hydrolysing)
MLGDLDTLDQLPNWARRIPGSRHVLASLSNQVGALGSVTSIRRLFHAEVAGVDVASDRPEVLAWLLSARVDLERLAVHLLSPLLQGLASLPVWRGVKQLAPDRMLVFGDRHSARTVRWWDPPQASIPLEEGAAALRRAMRNAVNARVVSRKLVSTDLGGLDSTSLCCLAARSGAEVVAFTGAGHDPLSDDVLWAERTVAALGNVEHHVVAATDVPLRYEGLQDERESLSEPCSSATNRTRYLHIIKMAQRRGSQLHLTGLGGDEILMGSEAHIHTLVRTSPRAGWRMLRDFSAVEQWPKGAVVKQLRSNHTFREWLSKAAGKITAPPESEFESELDWGSAFCLPDWVTPEVVQTVRNQVIEFASTAEPFSRFRGIHRELEELHESSRMVSELAEISARHGILLAAPYYDDQVVEAGLAVRAQDRVSARRYKPMMAEAMRGIVPEQTLLRDTKPTFDETEIYGMRENRSVLLDLAENSRLSQEGLVDARKLRAACSGPLSWRQTGMLQQTLACELWLRELENDSAPSVAN